MESVWTGSNLTDVQSARTNQALDAGATSRARVAADATKMSAYFNLLSNKARTEAESYAKNAENARLYFATNLQDAQKKAELSQIASQNALQWGNQAQMAKATLEAQERMGAADNLARMEVAKFGTRIPQLEVEKLRQVGDQQVADRETKELSQMSDSLAAQLNQALSAARSKRKNDQEVVWNADVLPLARRQGMAVKEQEYKAAVSAIHSSLGNNASLVRYNPNKDQFEPAISISVAASPVAASVRNVAPVMPGVAPVIPAAGGGPGTNPNSMQSYSPIYNKDRTKVNVVDAQGNVGWIPVGNLRDALMNGGFKLAQ